MRGGAFLLVRDSLGLGISLGGILLLTRLLGPTNYGLYAGPIAIVLFLTVIGRIGVDVFLVRREEDPEPRMYDQAFTMLLIAGLVLAAITFLTLPLLRLWYRESGFVPPLEALLLVVPVSLMTLPAIARLERDLNYRAVALLELSGQIVYTSVALTLAWQGFGVWAPVTAYWCSQTWLLVRSCMISGYQPRLHLSRPMFKEIMSYSLGFSISQWVWTSRLLVNPLVIGRYLGPDAVAYVSLAIKFADLLGFVKTATWRLSIAALSKVQHDYNRLRNAMEEAMGLQILASGPVFAGFALIAPYMVPLLFGSGWDTGLKIYPFVALSYLANAVFSMQISVLYVLKHNWNVAAFHFIHIVLFAGAALILVSQMGLFGYALAEAIALVGYLYLHVKMTKIFRYSYASAVPWLIAFVPPLFSVYLPLPWKLTLWIPMLLVLAVRPQQRRQIKEYSGYVLAWRSA